MFPITFPISAPCASPPGDCLLGKTTGNWTTRYPAPFCLNKACGSGERSWPWDPPAMETSSTPRLLPVEGASVGQCCMPRALLPAPELPAEVENVLFKLTNGWGFFLYLFIKENLILAFLLRPSLSLLGFFFVCFFPCFLPCWRSGSAVGLVLCWWGTAPGWVNPTCAGGCSSVVSPWQQHPAAGPTALHPCSGERSLHIGINSVISLSLGHAQT